MAENKFPSEMIDLPSNGKCYPEDSPLFSGKIEIKYMTAKEEDILTSANLIKKGLVINKLLDSLIVNNDIKQEDLVLGDKNAVMVAARILAYGPEYTAEITNPNTGNKINYQFNLADCPFKTLPDNVKGNEFEITLPVSKSKVKFKLLTAKEEFQIEEELKAIGKTGIEVIPELTTRMRHAIISVDGKTEKSVINSFTENMLARDSMFLREEIQRVSPDIQLTQKVDIEGDTVEVAIPMTVNFFWPNTQS